MGMLKRPVSFETTFGVYVVRELLGEGGAGRVYGGTASDGTSIALKVLAEERSSVDKRRRFKNEIAFLQRNQHRHIVSVIDHGIARAGEINGPFYIMKRYHCSLRPLMMKGIAQERVLPLFSQILDGVEAAHEQEAVHRDLKPENILYDQDHDILAVGDFGIASFTEEMVATTVKQRQANALPIFNMLLQNNGCLERKSGLCCRHLFSGTDPQ